MRSGLAGLQVIELGGGISAPMAAKVLADLGASVVKVEPPGGDPVRRRGPFAGGKAEPEASGTFLYLNTNKRSVVLDLSTAEGREKLDSLAAMADLLVHGFSPREMESHGISFERLHALNPRLVMLSITPFGLDGPYRDYAGNELVAVHGGGWGWIIPGKGTPPERPPIKPFGQHVLVQAGLHGAMAALAACRGVIKSGLGTHIDQSVQETVAFLLGRHFSVYSYTGKADARTDPSVYEPMNIYPCKDGFIYLICPEQAQWERLVNLMGEPDWAMGPECTNRETRGKHVEFVREHLSEWTRSWEVEELFHTCQRERVGAGPVFDYKQLERQEHLISREFFTAVEHPVAGEIRLPGAPYHLKQPWWNIERPAPILGEAQSSLDEAQSGSAALFRPAPESHKGGDGTERSSTERIGAGGVSTSARANDAGGDGTERSSTERNNTERTGSGVNGTERNGAAPPLAGIRVLDLSWVWAGPHCTMMMGFLGAEVIKVESSTRLDLTRRSLLVPPGMEHGPNRSAYFNQINQAKKSMGVNLSQPEGVALVKKLAAECDVMISNFGTGVLEKLGLGPEEMQRINPDLTVAMISAFGQTGPSRHYMGYGPLISPIAGVSAQTGYEEDSLPRDVTMAYGDPNGGVYCAVAIAAALWSRLRHGSGGQVIDVSMWEAMLNTGFEGWMNHELGNPPYAPMGNHDPVDAPHNVYHAKGEDTWVALAATDEEQWRRLCEAMGQPELAADKRFGDAAARKANEAELDALIGEWCAGRDRWHITHAMQARGVPAFPVLSTPDLQENEHLLARGCFRRIPHAEVGTFTLMGAPWKVASAPVGSAGGAVGGAPLLGEHTDQILEHVLGLDAAERTRLREAGIVE